MALHHLIYQSTARLPFSDEDLRALLTKARAFNSAHHISGVLLYHDKQFVQVLEGEETVLLELYDNILHDPRHIHIVKLADAFLAQRSFGEWSMAFRPVLTSEFVRLPGYLSPDALAHGAETTSTPDAAAGDLLAQIIHLTFHTQAEVE